MGGLKPMKQDDITRMIYALGGHTFNKTYWPHVIEITVHDYDKAERFCYDNFRSRNWRSQGPYFGFKRKEDYEWFVLRWS